MTGISSWKQYWYSYSELLQHVNCLCRACGERVKREVKKKKVTCLKLCVGLANSFSIIISVLLKTKKVNTPKELCYKCYQTRINCNGYGNVSRRSTTLSNAALDIKAATTIWTDFDSSLLLNQCIACMHFENRYKGGKPSKKKEKKSRGPKAKAIQK